MTSPNWNIEWVWGIAIVVLAIAFVYGIMQSRRRTRAEKQTTENATRQRYREGDDGAV